jgi:hypothetical protein
MWGAANALNEQKKISGVLIGACVGGGCACVVAAVSSPRRPEAHSPKEVIVLLESIVAVWW